MTLAICVYYLVWYCLSFFSGLVSAEEVVSVNKPIVKSAKPWHFSSDEVEESRGDTLSAIQKIKICLRYLAHPGNPSGIREEFGVTQEYVRCFCNLPSCVMTGYMCKSSGGGCFSDVAFQTNNDKGRHGCLELLEEKYKCHGKSGAHERTTFRRIENTKSHLMCCHYDMCNHIESPQTKNLINSTLLDDSVEETDSRYQQKQETFLYSDSEVWFRAATIAVPICGAVILFVLIALAVKILKSEHQNSAINKLGPTLYIQPISSHKNSKEKHNQDNFHRTYDNLLRKDYIISPHNNFYCNHSGDYQPQFREPLIQCESSTSGEEKKSNHARYNLINYEESGKSIILEIEKEKPPCSQVNDSNNSKYADNVNKFCVEKTFLS